MWLAAAAAFAITGAAAAAGALYQREGVRRDRDRFPPPGSLLDAAGTRLHVRSLGEGEPLVVFEAGIAASSVSWAYVQGDVAQFARTRSYDRAGYAWSGRCATARTVDVILAELDAVIGGSQPVVLVGHSFGGLIALLYASRRPGAVSGLVLVDPALMLEWASPSRKQRLRLRTGIALSRRGAWLCRIGVVRAALEALASGRRALPKAIAYAASGPGAGVVERLVGEVKKLPEDVWPAVQSHWSRPECFESMAAHLEALPGVASEAARVASLGSMPLTIISGAHLSSEQQAEHAALARLSTRGRHMIAPAGGHWVHLDEHEFVAHAVADVIARR